jgi:hypothetical protein
MVILLRGWCVGLYSRVGDRDPDSAAESDGQLRTRARATQACKADQVDDRSIERAPSDATPPDDTTAGITPRGNSMMSRMVSRLVVLTLLVACVASLLGFLGGRTATATASDDGYRLTLSYPETSRPGLDIRWQLSVDHPGGFGHAITIAVSARYFDLFETQGFYPTPAETTRDARFVYLKFTPPPQGATFRVLFDAYLQPYIPVDDLLANDAVVALVVHKKNVVTLHYRTWVLP